jgi:hypothetical protein
MSADLGGVSGERTRFCQGLGLLSPWAHMWTVETVVQQPLDLLVCARSAAGRSARPGSTSRAPANG